MHSNPGFRALSYCRDRRDNRQWMTRKGKEGISGNPFWPATTGRKGRDDNATRQIFFCFLRDTYFKANGNQKDFRARRRTRKDLPLEQHRSQAGCVKSKP